LIYFVSKALRGMLVLDTEISHTLNPTAILYRIYTRTDAYLLEFTFELFLIPNSKQLSLL